MPSGRLQITIPAQMQLPRFLSPWWYKLLLRKSEDACTFYKSGNKHTMTANFRLLLTFKNRGGWWCEGDEGSRSLPHCSSALLFHLASLYIPDLFQNSIVREKSDWVWKMFLFSDCTNDRRGVPWLLSKSYCIARRIDGPKQLPV